MKSGSRLLILVAATAVLGGCATMSGDECVTGDWTAIGYEDGSRGYTSDRLGKYRKSCAKHGVTPDFSAYQSGRQQGLVEYCQPSRGFNVGANGGRYNGVCNVDLEREFLEAYRTGHHLYSLRSEVNHATASLNAKERELEDIDDLVAEKQVALIADDTSKEDRLAILLELKDLSEETGVLEAEIRELHEIRARTAMELEQYQLVVADLGY